MQTKKRALGFFLLCVYLLTVSFQNYAQSELIDLDQSSENSPHKHGDFDNIHHEHHFHVGIFHFLGHLIHSIGQADVDTADHIYVSQNTSVKKILQDQNPINELFCSASIFIREKGFSSFRGPPYSIPFLISTAELSAAPLRGPPLHV